MLPSTKRHLSQTSIGGIERESRVPKTSAEYHSGAVLPHSTPGLSFIIDVKVLSTGKTRRKRLHDGWTRELIIPSFQACNRADGDNVCLRFLVQQTASFSLSMMTSF